MGRYWAGVGIWVAIVCVAYGAPPEGFVQNGPPPRQNDDGPWNRDVIAYRVSKEGVVEKGATFERAGVPTIGRMKDDRLIVAHQHFPEKDEASFDKVAVHFSKDEGKTWSDAAVITVEGLPEGMRFPFDPTLVPLPDGRVRLYFTGNYRGRASTPAIHSAISKDGIAYTYEPGVRFSVDEKMIIDCAAVLHGDVFHLFVPDNGTAPGRGQQGGTGRREGTGYHATSKDGLEFKRMEDVQVEGRRNWLGNAQSDGKQITFFGTGEPFRDPAERGAAAGGPPMRPRGGMWMATSEDGQKWKVVPNPAVTGGDPGAVRTRDGGWVVVITGETVRRVKGR